MLPMNKVTKMNGNSVKNKARSGNTGCCVVSCHNTYGKTDSNTKFYSFPTKPHLLERRQRWIQAVNRINSDGSPWQPTKNSRICSYHFIGGSKSEDPRHLAYYPTIFPNEFKRKEHSQVDLDHFNCWKKRKVVSEVFSTINGDNEDVNNFCEHLQFIANIIKPLKFSKSVQVASFQDGNNDFIFSCDFDRESNSVLTQATIPSSDNKPFKSALFTADKSCGPDVATLLS